MNYYLIVAAFLCFLLGLVHSIMGELLIFIKLRNNQEKERIKKITGMGKGHLSIMWATWHLASILGWCIGSIILLLAIHQNLCDPIVNKLIFQSIAVCMLMGSALVGLATKGKHPGWVVLLVIGILLSYGG